MKTEYERKVESGELEPLKGLDAMFIDMLVCDIISKGDCTEDEKETCIDLWLEIEFVYKDDEDTLNSIKKIVYEN